MRASASVCINVQECGKHAKDLIESVLPQLSDGDEILVCGAAAHEASEGFDDSRIQLLKESARCFYDITKLCKNEIIFFGSENDVWAENRVERVLSAFEEDPACTAVLHDMYTFRSDTAEKGDERPVNYKKGFGRNLHRASYNESCMAIRRSFAVKACTEMEPEAPVERLIGLLSEKAGKTVYIPEKLVYHRIGDEKKEKSEGSLKEKTSSACKLYCEYEVIEDSYYRHSTEDSFLKSSGKPDWLKKAAWVFIALFFIDCCITGSGRLIEFGYISFRMLVFAAAFILSLPLVIKNRKRLIKDHFVYLTLIFGAALVIWSVYGYLNDSPIGHIRTDIVSCMTLVLLPGMLCVVDSREKVIKLVDTIYYSSLLLAFAAVVFQFVLPHAMGSFGSSICYFVDSYQIGGFSALETGTYRIYFRSGIFTQVAIMLGIWKVWHAGSAGKKILFTVFEGIMVYFWIISYTRGFWAGLGASVLFVALWQPRIFRKCLKVGLCSLLVAMIITGLSWINEGAPNVPVEFYNRIVITVEQSTGTAHGGKQNEADIYANNIRALTKKRQKEYISQYPVFGRGIGSYLVGLRLESAVEYTYLDVLMKLGIVGAIPFALAFFVFLRRAFIHRVFRPKQDPENSFYTLTTLIMAGYIGVAVTSITNPFLISPLGITVLLITEAAVYNCRIFDKKAV